MNILRAVVMLILVLSLFGAILPKQSLILTRRLKSKLGFRGSMDFLGDPDSKSAVFMYRILSTGMAVFMLLYLISLF